VNYVSNTQFSAFRRRKKEEGRRKKEEGRMDKVLM
jgi:hypothetical protein